MSKTVNYDFSAASVERYGSSAFFELPGAFPTLVLRGSRRERGYACGRLMGRRVMRYVPRFTTFVHALYGGWEPGTVPTGAQLADGKRASRDFVYKNMVPEMVKVLPGVWEEVIAMYDGMRDAGADIDFDDLVMLQTIPENFLRPKNCSSFAAWGNATKDGSMIQGVNQDQDTFGCIHESSMMIALDNDDGYSSIGPAFGVGVLQNSYVNSAGMSYGEMTSMSGREKWPQLPHYWQARLMAERAATIDEAYELSKLTGGTTGWVNLMTQTRGSRAAASIELVAELAGIRRPTAARPDRIYATNHFMGYPGIEGYEGPEMVHEQFEYYAAISRKAENYFSKLGLSWKDVDTLEKWQANFRCPRFELYESKLDEWHGSIDVDKAIELQSTTPIGMGDDEIPAEMRLSPEFKGEYGKDIVFISRALRSIYTCVFKAEERAVWLAVGEQPAQKGMFYGMTLDGALQAAAACRK